MSVLDNLPLGHLDIVNDGLRLKKDHQLITAYTQKIEGVGLETLDADPAHQLIQQSLFERYGRYSQLGAGNEGLLMIAAIVGGGYLAYKTLMRGKNNPITKSTKDLQAKITSTYTSTWIDGKESVDKDVTCGVISKLFKGGDFGELSPQITKQTTDSTSECQASSKYLISTWPKVANHLNAWKKADDEFYEDKAIEDLGDEFNEPTYKLAPAITILKGTGTGNKVSALTVGEYPKAVQLMKDLVSAFDVIDSLGEDVCHGVGFWDDFFDAQEKKSSFDEAFRYGYAEYFIDHFGSDAYKAREIILSLARGLEEWVVKSFK